MERACNETHDQLTNEYFVGMYTRITDWVGGKAAFGDDPEAMDTIFSIANRDRNACCGVDFTDARRLAEWSYFEHNTGDPFQSLRQKPTPPRGGIGPCLLEDARIVPPAYHVGEVVRLQCQVEDAQRLLRNGNCLCGVPGIRYVHDS